MTDPNAKLQRKLQAQKNELARITQSLEGLGNDLRDIKAQRDILRDFVRSLAEEGTEPLASRARHVLAISLGG